MQFLNSEAGVQSVFSVLFSALQEPLDNILQPHRAHSLDIPCRLFQYRPWPRPSFPPPLLISTPRVASRSAIHRIGCIASSLLPTLPSANSSGSAMRNQDRME